MLAGFMAQCIFCYTAVLRIVELFEIVVLLQSCGFHGAAQLLLDCNAAVCGFVRDQCAFARLQLSWRSAAFVGRQRGALRQSCDTELHE